MTRIAAALSAALALAGCGDYSTEDLRFLAALPQREDLRVAVPATAEAAATAAAKGAVRLEALGDACAGSSEVWAWAKPTSDDLNALVEFLVGLVDTVRRLPPTWREEDARGWGPFDDENHPGRELQIGIARTWPEELAGAPRHLYAFQARVKGEAAFTTILFGTFEGGSAARGKGALLLDWEALHRLGMNDAETPHGGMGIEYDRRADPVTVKLYLDPDGGASGSEAFYYQFAGFASGGGVFDYAIRDASANVLLIATRYDAAGAGEAGVRYFPASGEPGGGFSQCWDASASLVHVDDGYNYSCDAGDCSCGARAACAEVPESPFTPPPDPATP